MWGCCALYSLPNHVPAQDDGGVVKKIITAGEGWEYPETGDEVTGRYRLTVCNTLVAFRCLHD